MKSSVKKPPKCLLHDWGKVFPVNVRGRIARVPGGACHGSLSGTERGAEEEKKRWGEKQTGWYQGYGNREDSKNGWRVLPDIGVMLQAGGGQVKPMTNVGP